MGEISFADKVNQAFDDGWNSNPQYAEALRDLEKTIEFEKRTLSLEEIIINKNVKEKNKETDEGR